MSKPRHTPGPWIVQESFNEDRKMHVLGIGPEGYSWIAKIQTVPEHGSLENMANARLIAAAPELLQAADYLLSLNREAGQTEWKTAMQSLARAVAKAEGREE